MRLENIVFRPRIRRLIWIFAWRTCSKVRFQTLRHIKCLLNFVLDYIKHCSKHYPLRKHLPCTALIFNFLECYAIISIALIQFVAMNRVIKKDTLCERRRFRSVCLCAFSDHSQCQMLYTDIRRIKYYVWKEHAFSAWEDACVYRSYEFLLFIRYGIFVVFRFKYIIFYAG